MAYLSPKLIGTSSEVFELEISDTSGYAVDWHAHDCHMLLLPRKGGLFLSTESSRPTLVSRQLFSLVPVDFAHATEAAPGREEHMTLYIDPDYVTHQGHRNGYRGFSKQVNRSGTWRASNALDSILGLHDELRRTTSTQAFQRQLPHLNHLIFEECARLIACEQASSPPTEHQQNRLLANDIQRYVRENLQADLSVDSIGHQFLLSRRHLTRIFKAATGETLLEFTNRIRVETAAQLVSSTSLSMLDVSLAVGLDSPSYLTRLFKRQIGLTPIQLRTLG